jgi:hypothetical protein
MDAFTLVSVLMIVGCAFPKTYAPVAEAAARAEAEGEEGQGVLHGVGPGLGGVREEALGAEGLRVGPVLGLRWCRGEAKRRCDN